MKYMITQVRDEGKIEYAVISQMNYGKGNKWDEAYENIYLVLDNLIDAKTLLTILNREDNKMAYHSTYYKPGDIVKVSKCQFTRGVIVKQMGVHYLVEAIDEEGNKQGIEYVLHPTQIDFI